MCIGKEVCDGEDYCTEFEAMVQKNAQFLGYSAISQREAQLSAPKKVQKRGSADDLREDLHISHPGGHTAFAAIRIVLNPRNRGLAADPPFVSAGELWRQN
jgi:hypothetical protein